jgi:hypothetical protein
MLRFLWRATTLVWRVSAGYRLCPWRSPYLRWRIETYSGVPAGSIGCAEFWRFLWRHRRDLMRFLAWAGRMR